MYVPEHSERQAAIENDNNVLVEKMMSSSSYIRPAKDARRKDSLNSIYRSRVDREIDHGNQVTPQRRRNWCDDCSRPNRSTGTCT
jgi:hypothetical protein